MAEVIIDRSAVPSPGRFFLPPVRFGVGPFPAVVLLHDITGAGADLEANARMIADQGYLVFAPDLYAPGRLPGCLVRTFRDLVRGEGRTIDTVLGARVWLASRDDCTGKVAVVGFCMGGGFALLTASRGFDAAAPFYGVAPRRQAVALEGACPVVASFGSRDPMLIGGARKLRATLDPQGIPHDVKTYAGVGHSFANKIDLGPLNTVIRVAGFGYDDAAAKDAWHRVFDFFAEHLHLGTDHGPSREAELR